MSTLVFDFKQQYNNTFGHKPVVGALLNSTQQNSDFVVPGTTQLEAYAKDGSLLFTKLHGVEVWLPTKFRGLSINDFEFGIMDLPYCVISIRGGMEWIETKLKKRKGTVKELFGIGDYEITLKGFLIDRARVWPYDDLIMLRKVYEAGKPFSLDNALTNIFLTGNKRVVMKSFDLYPVEAQSQHVRPFAIQLESDSIISLEKKA